MSKTYDNVILQSETPAINGYIAPGFERVREVFEENFRLRNEVGASFAVYRRGEKLVDLWGGFRDKSRRLPWKENTPALVSSTTKGIMACALAIANSRGWLDYDEKVSTYWPEFAQNGKSGVTVRQLLAHQAGLITLDGGIRTSDLADLDTLAVRLARQKPFWQPGDYQGYHTFTFGLYSNELLRRVDPGRRSIGRFLEEEMIGPLGGGFYIGLPDNVDPARDIAQISQPGFYDTIRYIRHMTGNEWKMMFSYLIPFTYAGRVAWSHKVRSFSDMMDPAFLQVEMPAGNGVGTARAVAQIYDRMATAGGESFIAPETLELLKQPPRPPAKSRFDRLTGLESMFSLGFVKPSGGVRFGTDDSAFGSFGGGGSNGFADPVLGIGVSYVPNYFQNYIIGDPREVALRKALYACF